MRDVVKTNVKREQTSKRARRRKKNRALYVFLVLILVLGIAVLLSVTLLFNIDKINIKGDVDYSNESIIKASGIEIGDNMVRLDAKEAEQNILSSMVYIEYAKISKKYPDTLEITLERCIPSANAEYDGGILLLSPKGKILESVTEPQADILTVKGLEPSSFNVGEYITSADKQKTEIYFEIMEALGKCKNSNVVSIDLTDKYDIKINYNNSIIFEAGNSNDIAYKIKLADTVLEDIGNDKKGTMVMVGVNQISFRTENSGTGSSAPSDQRIPIENTPESTTETESDEDQVDDEHNDDDYYYEQSNEESSAEEYYEEDYYEDEYQEDENYEYDDENYEQ